MSSEIPVDRNAVASIERELRARTSSADRLGQLAAKVFGLNRTDIQTLEVISRTGGVSPSELAREVGLTTGGMTTVIDRLESAGYASRSRDVRDRRKVVVEPTPLTMDREATVFGPLGRAYREIAASYDDQQLEVVLDFLHRIGEAQSDHGDSLAFEQRVRETFLEDGRLKLPARRKKRLVVLRWVADLFQAGERYPEAAVNRVLGRYYDDVATLRRLLIDEALLQRDAGIYWRTGTLPPE